MNPLLPIALGLAVHALPALQNQTTVIVLKSETPLYEVTLPKGYASVIPPEMPPRYFRYAGREPWAKVSAQLTPMDQPLFQNPTGITSEEILALVSPPPNSTTSISRKPWKNLEIGVIEYRAVVADLPVIGLSTILPLAKKALRITVFAPDPLEKDMREDFEVLLTTISQTETNWLTDEVLHKIATMRKVTIAGGVLFWLYPIAWVIFFRGRPLAAHWLRTGWLLAIALLLFFPITSPAPTSTTNNLVVNALFPLIFIILTVRRLRLGIDAD